MYVSETEIKQAVHRYCQRAFSADMAMDPPFVFSQEHMEKMRKLLDRADRRRGFKRMMKHAVACFAAVLLIFFTACIVSPKVWADVRSWYVVHIGQDQTVYQFEHIENDHAFLVVRPDALPEGMELKSIDEGDGYSIQEYENAKTGEYINFSYHWLTVKERAHIEQMAEQYRTVKLAYGYEAILYEDEGLVKLCWYEKYNLISYWAESNLPVEKLVNAFSEMEMHLPVYAPIWLPEEYELIDSVVDIGSMDFVYSNPKTGDIIIITIADYGIIPQLSVFGEGESRDVIINGREGVVSWGDGFYKGTVLFFIDRNENLVFTIQTGQIDPDMVIHIAESMQKAE